MKKEVYLSGLILLFILFGCATQEATEEQIVREPQPVEEVELAEENVTEFDEQLAVETEPEPVVEEFQIFNPVLTYDGAYNGPLYGTSEQVGSASMNSYFENLDRNGINFFI